MDLYALLMEIWPLLDDETQQELVDIARVLSRYRKPGPNDDAQSPAAPESDSGE